MKTELVKTINDSFARKKELERELLERIDNNQPLNDTYSKIQELDSIINNALKQL